MSRSDPGSGSGSFQEAEAGGRAKNLIHIDDEALASVLQRQVEAEQKPDYNPMLATMNGVL